MVELNGDKEIGDRTADKLLDVLGLSGTLCHFHGREGNYSGP